MHVAKVNQTLTLKPAQNTYKRISVRHMGKKGVNAKCCTNNPALLLLELL